MALPAPERLQLWRALLTTHSDLTRALTRALLDERELALPWFEAMNALQLAGGRVRVMDLAEHLVASPSSLSRQLDGMEQAGIVRRERGHPHDGRAVVVVLTPDGRAAWRRANTTYLRVVRKMFFDRLSDADVAAMQQALDKVARPVP